LPQLAVPPTVARRLRSSDESSISRWLRAEAQRVNAVAELFLKGMRRKLLDHILIANQRHAAAAPDYEQRHTSHAEGSFANPLPSGQSPGVRNAELKVSDGGPDRRPPTSITRSHGVL
jgi:hypothetical protein